MKTNKIREIKIKIKKYIFEKLLNDNLKKINDRNLARIYNIYDVDYNLDDELHELNKEFRRRYVNNLLYNDFESFEKEFKDFKTANYYINYGRY